MNPRPVRTFGSDRNNVVTVMLVRPLSSDFHFLLHAVCMYTNTRLARNRCVILYLLKSVDAHLHGTVLTRMCLQLHVEFMSII